MALIPDLVRLPFSLIKPGCWGSVQCEDWPRVSSRLLIHYLRVPRYLDCIRGGLCEAVLRRSGPPRCLFFSAVRE